MFSRSIVYGLASAVTLFALSGSAARANIDPDGDPPGTPISVVDNGNGTWTWSYNVILTSTEDIQTGDFFTFYDFNGYTGVYSVSSPYSFTETSQLLGPSPVVGATTTIIPADDGGIPNITFTYAGSAQQGPGPISLGVFSLESIYGPSSKTLEAFAARATEDFPDLGYPKNSNGTQYIAPAVPSVAPVPEPGEIAFASTFGMGLLGLIGRARISRYRARTA